MKIEIYGKQDCAYCVRAKLLCDLQSLDYTYYDIMEDDDALDRVMETGQRTVPQIFADGKHIGGFLEFSAYVKDKT